MKKANIIAMGKSGVGKSTLINAVLGEKKAAIGTGEAATPEIEVYKTTAHLDSEEVSLELLDTAGLELDSSLNAEIIQSVQSRIDELTEDAEDTDEIHMVWYCVNPNANRFEDFEADFIREMMYDYEIPVVTVLTQCYDEQQEEAMREAILKDFPDMPVHSVLAEKTSRVAAYGVQELLEKTVTQFNEYKLNILNEKLKWVNTDMEKQQAKREEIIELGRLRAGAIVREKAESAFVLGCIPVVSAVALQSQFTAVCTEVSAAFGIRLNEDAAAAIAAVWIVGLVVLPIALIPGLSGSMARYVIRDMGMEFTDIIADVIRDSTDAELYDSELISMRLADEIRQRKNG